MKYLNFLLSLSIAILLTGCAQNPYFKTKLSDSIYLDNQFKSNIVLETPNQIFHISPSMRSYVKTRLLTIHGSTTRTKRLIKDLFSEYQLNISYSHNANYTASETFARRSANCLSLTILSYVLVKEANLAASFIDVKIAENWNQVNGINMLNGHVNLKVSAKPNPEIKHFLERTITIDFVPILNASIISTKVLNRNEIIALFYNNKGAEALALSQVNIAYQYFAEATRYDPYNASIWGNLASLYRQDGYLAEAEQIYDHVMVFEPDNLNLKENLALLYRKTNRIQQANELMDLVQRRRQSNPFYQSMLAEERYSQGDYLAAISFYKKAIRLNRSEHSFYFGLAKSYLMINEFDMADKYLARAKSISQEGKQRQQYESKITALKTLTAKND